MNQFIEVIIFGCGFFMGLLGILALKQDRKNISHRLFFACTIACICWMTSLQIGFSATAAGDISQASFWFRIAHGSGLTALCCMFAFIYQYPQKTITVPPWLIKSFVGVSILLISLSAFTPLVYQSVIIHADGTLGDIFGDWFLPYIIFSLLIECGSSILAFRKIRQSRGLVKKKLQYTFAGFLVFVFATLMTNAILPLFEIIIFQQEAVLFSLFFLIPSCCSLYHHRFFNLSYSSLNLTRHVIMISAFWSVSAISYFILSNTIRFIPQMMSLGISMLIGLASYYWIDQQFPELISEAYRHFRKTLSVFQSKVYACKTPQALENLLHKTFIVQLNIRSAQLYLIRSRKRKAPFRIFPSNSFTQYLQTHHLSILVREELAFTPELRKYQKDLKNIRAQICFPLFSENELIGLFSLGPKGNGQSYGKEEIELILEVIQDLSNCFMNILLSLHLRKEKSVFQQSLQQQTHTLREEFNNTKTILQKQSDYISMAAHELRHPINVLMLQMETQLLNAEHDAQTQEDLKIMESSLQQLTTLTKNLFEAQQYDLEKMPLNLKQEHLKSFINSFAKEVIPLIKAQQLQFTSIINIKDDLTLTMDKNKISQVLHNIINNAIKFTPQNGKIMLKVWESSLNITLEIRDNGPGIAPEEQAYIFEKFQHGSKQYGLGMGLYLCKKIIQLHQGDILYKGRRNGGSTFTIVLRKNPVERYSKTYPHPRTVLNNGVVESPSTFLRK